MHKALGSVCFTFLLIFSVVSLSPTISVHGFDTSTEGSLSYEAILRGDHISLDRIREHVEFFTSNATPRVTGYPGFYKAQEYIYNEFNEYGLKNVTYQWYNITMPIDLGGELTVYHSNGTLLKSYPVRHLWPNAVQVSSTPPGGIMTKIFYAGQGDYSNYNGRFVNGSIVILDFNSEYNWLKAFELGAKAVVFIEPEDTNNYQSLTKRLPQTSLYAPRVCLQREYASDLLLLLNQYRGELDVKLESEMEWQVKPVANVVGFSPGTGSLKEQWIILFAHFDAWSVVPSLTEGATDACGIASLLEMAHFYSQVEHGRSIMFVAFSGHGEGLYGARYFVDSVFMGDSFQEVLSKADQTVGKGLFYSIGIDLSPETDSVGPVAKSDFFWQTFSAGRTSTVTFPAFYSLGGFVDKIRAAWNTVYGRIWILPPADIIFNPGASINFAPTQYVVDADAFGTELGIVFTYRTVYAWFDRKYTPADTLSHLGDLNNLTPQVEFAVCSSYDISYMQRSPVIVKPQDILNYGNIHYEAWSVPIFFKLTAQVVTYNESSGDDTPLPYAIVLVQHLSHLSNWVETADEKGYVTIRDLMRGERTIRFSPYLLNKTTSQIEYALDLGMYGYARFKHDINFVFVGSPLYGTPASPVKLVAFKSGTIQVFNIDVSMSAGATSYSPGMAWTLAGSRFISRIGFRVNDATSHSSLVFFGYEQELLGPYDTQPARPIVIFVPGNTPVEIIPSSTGAGGAVAPLAILHNSSLQNPSEGDGYTVSAGDTLNILHTPLAAAKELNYLNDERIKSMIVRNIFTTGSSYALEAAEEMRLAEEALRDLNYSDYHTHAVSALSLERQAYVLVKSELSSVLSATLTIFLIMLLFSYLAERLFFSSTQLKKQAIGILAFMVLGLAPMVILHPGFTMALNIYASMFGIIIIVFVGLVLAVILGFSIDAFRHLREKVIGKHFLEVSRITSLVTGMGLGVQYIRKRKLRAALTLTTLVIVSASIVMFTSVTSTSLVRATPEQVRDVLYRGIYIRQILWNPINDRLLDALEEKIGKDSVLPRAWLYPRVAEGSYPGFLARGPNGTSPIWGAYGLKPEESQLGWANFLKSGIWFEKGDYDACIITEGLADRIGAKAGDEITVSGAKLRVKGIFYGGVVNFRKLDGYTSNLKDPTRPATEPVFLAPDDVVYVTFRWAMDHGAKIHEIHIVSENIDELAFELPKEVDLEIYVAKDTGTVPVYTYSIRTATGVRGLEVTALPLTLAALTVLNLMLGAVYERTKEIGIFSTVGMSPSNVGMMFLSESLAFGVIGGILGYVAGIVGIRVLTGLGGLPGGFHPDYSSSFISQSLSILILVVVLSSLYPFLKAARLVTPSLERKWKITAKPLGDQWNVPTPFNFTSEKEAEGFVRYIKEYFEAYTAEFIGFPFAAQNISLKQGSLDGVEYKSMVADLHLAPFPANVNQTFELMVRNISVGRWNAEIVIKRLTGDNRDWQTHNQNFLNAIRKQFMNWRMLTPADKQKYYSSP